MSVTSYKGKEFFFQEVHCLESPLKWSVSLLQQKEDFHTDKPGRVQRSGSERHTAESGAECRAQRLAQRHPRLGYTQIAAWLAFINGADQHGGPPKRQHGGRLPLMCPHIATFHELKEVIWFITDQEYQPLS